MPPELRPPVNVVHLSYNVMVGIGFGLLGLAAWLAWSWWRRRDIPHTPWFLRAVALAGLAAVMALEAGWVVTEVGRQPWIELAQSHLDTRRGRRRRRVCLSRCRVPVRRCPTAP